VKQKYCDVFLKTLTPMWLGDIKQNSGSAREVGFIGSLRFWFEGILRGHNKIVCGIKTGVCGKVDQCGACALFGCTSFARRFRIELDGLPAVGLFLQREERYENGEEDLCGVSKEALFGDNPFLVRITPRRGDRERTAAIVRAIIRTAAECGGLGARTHIGFGQVRVESQTEGDATWDKQVLEAFIKSLPNATIAPTAGLFSLNPASGFFQNTYEVDPLALKRLEMVPRQNGLAWQIGAPYLPLGLHLRNSIIRPVVGGIRDDDLMSDLFGRPGFTSRLHVSHFYSPDKHGIYQLKVWGEAKRKQTEVEKAIYSALRFLEP